MEKEVEDKVDSDFDIDEDDELIEDPSVVDEPKRKRKTFTKAYKVKDIFINGNFIKPIT